MRVSATTEWQFYSEECSVSAKFRCGVSLHSHTMYSEEPLGFLARWASAFMKFDLGCCFWTPPLSPLQAHCLEQKQIESAFHVPGFVSLTDHDNIRAAGALRVLDQFHDVPVSTEWTVPFGPTFFHLGVHNLPRDCAGAIMHALSEITLHPQARVFESALDMLNSHPNILLVLNHPLWDEKHIGRARHAGALNELLGRYGRQIHALEVNGLRSWRENRCVILLGREAGLPVVAGGDRHGLEPNAVLNLSHATNFGEFIEEVRVERFSRIVVMPQYCVSRRLRILHMIVDVLRDYPDTFSERGSWTERVFYRDAQTGVAIPFAAFGSGRAAHLVAPLLAATRWIDKRPPSAILTSA